MYLNHEATFYESPTDQFFANLNPNPKYLKIFYTYLDTSDPDNLQGKTVADGAILFKVRFTRTAIGTASVSFNGALLPFPEFSAVTTGNNTNLITPVGPVTTTSITAGGTPPPTPVPFTIYAEKDTVQTGKTTCIDIKTLSFDSMTTVQFGILYDTTKLTFKELRLCHSLSLQLNSDIVGPPGLGGKKQVRLSWSSPDLTNGTTIADNATLFGVCFPVTGAANTLAPITVANNIPDPPFANFVADFQDIHGTITDAVLTNGHVVASNIATPTFTLGNNTVAKGQTTCVEVKVSNFSQIDTFTLNVMYVL